MKSVSGCLLVAAVCCALAPHAAAAKRSLLDKDQDKELSTSAQYLYAWAGAKDASLGGKDSLFVISLVGAEYGQVVSVVPTPYNGIEPHHCRASADKKILGCGGLLSPLAPPVDGAPAPSVIFFDITNPRVPKLVDAALVDQPNTSAFADEFITTPDGGFLATMMGSSTGGSPGRVVQYSKDFKLVGEYPDPAASPDVKDLNPHGIAVSWTKSVMLTVDFLVPASTLKPATPVLWKTVRLWDTNTMTIKETIDCSALGVNGPMDAVAIAETGAFYFGGGDGNIYYLDADGSAPHTPVVAWDTLSGSTNRASAGNILHSFRSGTRLLVSSYTRDQVQLLDTSKPRKPKLLDTLQLPAGAGAHVVRLSEDEAFGAVATYFLDEGAGGRVVLPGDMTLRLFFLNDKASKFVVQQPSKSVIDFKTLMGAQGVYRVHGAVIL
ncbi:hypothetical protein HXX76_010885 [Chlamydomonas incerta]|uniref:Methanethiol oxidase n=1 Tax=Chlamydomonas incerta TaxID=51695 RepID=A0A835VVZ3_CHLIN|nr:hypothetical protein HXX76_010885 [Chlamydomonas incerta]|eukprot:KAG2427166.1 hypothetical protein HXX76_010885 [Chlamydomonas incerta]